MYAVKLPLNIGGRRRKIGELIDDAEVKSPELVSSGYLVKITGASGAPAESISPEGLITLPVIRENGTETVSVAQSGIAEAVRIMQLSQADAVEAVKTAENDTLIVLDLCEGNKTIKSAVRKGGSELAGKAKAEAVEAGDA